MDASGGPTVRRSLASLARSLRQKIASSARWNGPLLRLGVPATKALLRARRLISTTQSRRRHAAERSGFGLVWFQISQADKL